MSGTYPTTPSFESVNFQINVPTQVVTVMSGQSQRVGMGIQFYSFSARYVNVTQFQMGPVIGFLGAQYGPLEDFQIVLPEISYSKNPFLNQSINATTTANANIGDNQVNVQGITTSGTWLLAGDFFKFDNHSKVYMATADYAVGEPLYFNGSLVEDVPSGTSITYTEVPFTVSLDNEIQQYSVGVGGIMTMSVDMREVWQ